MYHGSIILLEADRHLWQILAPVPDRLVACHTGFAADFPRNLSKTLTVD
jgi:hypothetical protein